MIDPFQDVERTDSRPRADDSGAHPSRSARTSRSFDAMRASHALLPRWLRRRALAVRCTTDRDRYARDEPIHLQLTVRNRLPVPLCLRTTAPVPWTWAVDDLDRASTNGSLPEDPGTVDFTRRERKTFRTRWYQRFEVADGEWVAADPGKHVLSARLLVDESPLSATTTVRIE